MHFRLSLDQLKYYIACMPYTVCHLMLLCLLFLLGGYLFVSKIPYFEKHQLDESAERKSNSENSKIKINAAGLKVWETL